MVLLTAIVVIATVMLQPVVSFVTVPNQPIVTTKSGQLRGQLVPEFQVYQFSAIPFAEPPVGNLRFKKPVPKAPWVGVRDASTTPNACPQLKGIAIFNGSAIQQHMTGVLSEDCLYLNIWVPKATLDKLQINPNKTSLLPVYTFIHGGAFVSGSTSVPLYDGGYFAATNKVIVATIQYRLGSLGFAYLGTRDIPGNMGLWDQVEALKWLSNNLASFGGDKGAVTIGGESAGAASVTYHLLSPYSRPYFQRAIVESGTANAPWASHSKDDASNGTRSIFNGIATVQVNCAAQQRQTVDCVNSVDSGVFPIADAIATSKGFLPGPVIDNDFIPDNPSQMITTGNFYQVPLLIGVNKDEGSIFLMESPEAQLALPMQPNANETAKIDALNFTDFVTLLGGAAKLMGQGTINQLAIDAIKYAYWQNGGQDFPAGKEVVDAIVAVVGDCLMTCPTFSWIEQTAKVGNMSSQIYAYYFNQRLASASFHYYAIYYDSVNLSKGIEC